MVKKLYTKLSRFFIGPKLNEVQPAISRSFIAPRGDDTQHHTNVENISLAELQLQREALQKGLTIQHRTMLITFLAVLISLILGVYAVRSKPNISVELHEEKSTQEIR